MLRQALRTPKTRWALALAVLVVLLDAFSKELARQLLETEVALVPLLLDLRLVFNTGISFGLLADAPAWVGGTVVALGLTLSLFALWQVLNPQVGALASIGWALFAAGALGNLWERVFRGAVTDFLALKLVEWPLFVFNVADFALSLAILLILLADWIRPRAEAN